MSSSCRVTPRGDVVLENDAGLADRVTAAFARGHGFGLLQLGAGELESKLDPSASFFRDLAKTFVTSVCGAMDPHAPEVVVIPEPASGELEPLAQAAPPMRGAELVSVSLLEGLWTDMGAALTHEATSTPGGLAALLASFGSMWNLVGRVSFHIAENKADRAFPFAFIATYTRALSKRGTTPIYVPLGRALEEYAGARNKQKLIALLSPLERAAQESELMRALVDSGDIYHPLAWSADDAHRFLREVPVLERAGLSVRTPDWWSARRRPRPRVTVAVGGRQPSGLGMDALLDFDVSITIDGAKLTQRDIDKLMKATAGLVLIRGKWVEVDGDKLSAVLDGWQRAQKEAQEGGLSMAEAMRLLAGADVSGGLDETDGANVDDRPEWSRVVAGKWLDKRLEALRNPTIRKDIERGAGLHAELRPYQKVGVSWLWMLHELGLGGCLADDMGLGKTVQVIALMSLLRRKKRSGTDLLVVPASLIHNWLDELTKFAPHLTVLLAHPSQLSRGELNKLTASALDDVDAVITTYAMVSRSAVIAEHRWRCVMLDEAQAIKNPGAKQTRRIKQLTGAWKLALTGTPVENHLGDLWSIFDFLNPGLLGGRTAFNRLCKRMESKDGPGYAPLRSLVQPYILRRLKTDKRVITDLPDKVELTTRCLLSKAQAALYQQSVDELAEQIRDAEGIARRGIVLAFLMRFKQICNHPSQWLADEAFAPKDSGKFMRLSELCEPMAARQEKVLIFTQFRSMTAPIADLASTVFGGNGLVLHGGTSVKKRKALVDQFQRDEATPFMVLSLKAGGTGLNLTAASHVIHFDRWWNPAVEDQATDRAFRIGQKNNVMVHKFVCQGTVEERIDELIGGKRKLVGEVLQGGAETQLTELSNDALIELVSLDVKSALA